MLAHVADRTDDTIQNGTLLCPACQHEFPILDGVPVIVPGLRQLLNERGLEMMLRDDLNPVLESLLGDAIGPDSWLDAIRQTQSSYMWDGYADLDPHEPPPLDGPVPGAARRCLARLLALRGNDGPLDRILDLGCASGRTSFELAASHPQALVLGVDIHLGLLRLAQNAAAGHVSYPRRRIGLVYDRQRFDVRFPGSERVDFWACNAMALPFKPAIADLCVALNLLDCVPDPRQLLTSLAAALRAGGHILLATPYDWSTRATPVDAWLGGHSQRGPNNGAGEPIFHALVDGATPYAVPGLALHAEEHAWPWHTRLHDRSTVQYRTHLTVLTRETPAIPASC